MTKEEAINVLNAAIAVNVEVTFIESKVEAGHKVRFAGEPWPVQTYSVALSKLQSLASEKISQG